MIKEKTIKIRIASSNVNHYISKGYDCNVKSVKYPLNLSFIFFNFKFLGLT